MQLPVTIHCEGGHWWAEAEALPGFTAVADSIERLRPLIAEAVTEHLGSDVAIIETYQQPTTT